MASKILDPVSIVLTASYVPLTVAPAVGKVRRYDIRFANVGIADGLGSLQLTNGTVVINRAITYPVPFQAAGSAPDMEIGILLPAGWFFQARATAVGVIEASAYGVESDATDFN